MDCTHAQVIAVRSISDHVNRRQDTRPKARPRYLLHKSLTERTATALITGLCDVDLRAILPRGIGTWVWESDPTVPDVSPERILFSVHCPHLVS